MNSRMQIQSISSELTQMRSGCEMRESLRIENLKIKNNVANFVPHYELSFCFVTYLMQYIGDCE